MGLRFQVWELVQLRVHTAGSRHGRVWGWTWGVQGAGSKVRCMRLEFCYYYRIAEHSRRRCAHVILSRTLVFVLARICGDGGWG